jgi:DNA integrity scanning protein DisA with diadenylate cyclase activity
MKRQLDTSACLTEPECVACSLFQILFDISMKRHGGLLILDDPSNINQYVGKGIERNSTSPLNVIFTHSAFSGLVYSIPEVRKLVELSSIDGALILDLHGNLLQVGSMIMSHPSTPNRFGMREAAAYSATKHGATAFKVSADGHMSMFFSTPRHTGTDVHQFDFR